MKLEFDPDPSFNPYHSYPKINIVPNLTSHMIQSNVYNLEYFLNI